MHTLILPPPRNRAHVADYARAVNACLTAAGTSRYLNLSIRIPIYVPPAATVPFLHASSQPNLQASENELIATWEMWDVIRTICGYHPRLSLSKFCNSWSVVSCDLDVLPAVSVGFGCSPSFLVKAPPPMGSGTDPTHISSSELIRRKC
jgi:hypothetical protein